MSILEDCFYGKILFENGLILYSFTKNSRIQKLVHGLKYYGRVDVGRHLGRALGHSIKLHFDKDMPEYIIPVPLHDKRKRKRGYNQSYILALGISDMINVPIDTISLIRKKNTSTQTQKSANERMENVNQAFSLVEANHLIGKHVLLIDDILTTGSTINACVDALLKVSDIKLSLAFVAHSGEYF
ncbi:MAG: ComF family protein [Hyphomicrobiales bacterium]